MNNPKECDHLVIMFPKLPTKAPAKCLDCETEWDNYALTLTQRVEKKSA